MTKETKERIKLAVLCLAVVAFFLIFVGDVYLEGHTSDAWDRAKYHFVFVNALLVDGLFMMTMTWAIKW